MAHESHNSKDIQTTKNIIKVVKPADVLITDFSSTLAQHYESVLELLLTAYICVEVI